MKIQLIIFALLLFAQISCKNNLNEEIAPLSPTNITAFQQFMLDEINLARTNPGLYADLRLKSDRDNASDNGSYDYLASLTPQALLTFSNSLNVAASNYAQFLAEKNVMGHEENGTPLKRAIMVGFDGSTIGENIAASVYDSYNSILNPQGAAINFIRLMIIDNGVSDLGHRTTMLNCKYKTVGIGYNRNPTSTYINYNVQDFGNL